MKKDIGIFHDLVLEVLVDFRRILKRYSANKDERDMLLGKFDLRRKRSYDADLELYQSAQAIQEHLAKQMESKPRQYYAYSGIEQYYAHLQQFLSQYYVAGRKVEHKSQRIWRVMLDIIQLVSVATADNFSADKLEQLRTGCIEIAYYANDDQKSRLLAILQAKVNEMPDVFTAVQHDFKQAMEASKQESAA